MVILISIMLDVINAQNGLSITVNLQSVGGNYTFYNNSYNNDKINFYYSGIGNWTISLLASIKNAKTAAERAVPQTFTFVKWTNPSNIINDIFFPPAFNINTYVKLPMAPYSKRKGEYSYGFSVTLRKLNKSFFAFASLGYAIIASPLHINYRNPLSYGFGIGKFFYEKSLTSWFFYHSYSKIIENNEPPELISVGFNYRIYTNVIIYFLETLELSGNYSENSFSGGLKWNL